ENQKTSTSAIVVDQALPGRLISNNLLRNLGLALSTALLIGLAIAFLRDYLDYTIHSPDELKQVLNLPVMSTIGLIGSAPRRGRTQNKHNKSPAVDLPVAIRGHNLVTLEHPKSPEA